MSNLVIAIDGPSASGKSTIANLIAEKLEAYYINTGNMYRAAALAAVESNLNLDDMDEERLAEFIQNTSVTYKQSTDKSLVLMLNNKPVGSTAIRSPEVSQWASKISVSKVIREWLVNEQRKFTKFGLIIMEGRDIGTNVFPNARYKFFLTATPEARAIRRLKQDGGIPADTTIATVAKEIAERDKRDSTRKTAPLKQAEDAILVDSTNMAISEVVDYVVAKIVSLSSYSSLK